MAKEICISSTPHETRLAILEDDQLSEIYYERENEYTLAGSIYNGRVTRVLPGMQSAFVDLGLERDAFLYVTDFLELGDDDEESEEIEKAAVSGATQAPREVRRSHDRSQARGQDRPERGERQDRGERQERSRRAEPEPATESESITLSSPSESEHEGEPSGEPGAKRWRGRRRRRGRAGGSVSDPVESESSSETYLEPATETPSEPEFQATGIPAAELAPPAREARPQRERERDHAPAAFVLPGESLSKYGGEPAALPEKPAAAPRPTPTTKPSTLIDSPIQWDGVGLFPGESLARHRKGSAEPEHNHGLAEPEGTFEDVDQIVSAQTEAPEHGDDLDEKMDSEYVTPSGYPVVNFETVEEEIYPEEPAPSASEVQAPVAHSPFSEPEGQFSDTVETEHHAYAQSEDEQNQTGLQETVDEEAARAALDEGHSSEHHAEAGPEEDRSASHNVDPLPPSEFRLFGLGGKKKKDGEGEHGEFPAPTPIPADPAGVGPVASGSSGPTSPRAVSSFVPGSGVIEEEVIEEEEFEAPRHHSHRGEEHDLDDYVEEETLHSHNRNGEIGEMLQEAHLDHRIQLNFDDKNGEDDVDVDEEEETGEPAAEGATPAETSRRDRGGRGRRGGRGQQGDRRGGRGPSRRSAQTSDLPIISDLLKPGQEILVQIAKEPIAKKGARITSHIALPGRFLVFMPTVTHVGVSRKISSDEERQRLKRILISERGERSGGFIVRTAAEGATEDELRADLRFLLHLWDEIKQRSEKSKAPALIYHDLSLIERILRDQVSENFSSIWVDSQEDYERIVRFLNRFAPNMVRRVKLYTKETPLFEHFGIQDEISKALRSKVWLKSGGSIVINQTEALVAIDINTGKYVGKTARLEDTIVKTNLDAIPEIVRQIRLRDLGGIIIIDFIDMDERKNRFKVMAALEEALKNDRAPTKVLQFNDFGLVAITRKRVKQSLERTLSVPCYTCQATGMVKSPSTVANEIYIELRKMRKHFDNSDVLLRVHPETVKVLKANNARWLTDYEDLIGKNILVKSDASLHPEQFDIQG